MSEVTQLAALREELANRTDRVAELAQQRNDLQQRLADAERRNGLLESQVLHKDAGIEFRDALINAVRMSSKELLMAWVPSDWESKRAAINKPQEAKS
jgi:hypothetical protein